MHPVAGEGAVVGRFGLGHLVLVVGEDQIEAAAVDVDGDAQGGLGHGRALDVPAGATRAPGALPGGLAGLARLPEREVGGVALAGHEVLAAQAVDLLAGQLAVLLEGGDGVPGGSLADVGVLTVDEAADHLLDVVDALAHPGLVLGVEQPESVGVLVVERDVLLGQGDGLHAALVGPLDDLVVHVREVADEGDLPFAMPQVADEAVEDDEGAGVADVGPVVHGHPAHVQADVSGADGLEVFDPAAERVVDAEWGGHGGSCGRAR